MDEHEVGPGECLASIAARHGLPVDEIWNHPDNEALRLLRKDPFVLREGDKVKIPPRRTKTVTVKAGGRHIFVMSSARCDFRLRLRSNGEPRANEPWVLHIEGQRMEGTTDAEGWVEASIPARAKTGVLELRDGRERHTLAFGALDPIDTTRGVQNRLASLGYYRHREDDDDGPWTARALRAFQIDQGLEVTGEADLATRDRLRAVWGR